MESATIRFGDRNHQLRFRTVGQGHLATSADFPVVRIAQGTIIDPTERGWAGLRPFECDECGAHNELLSIVPA